jgi:hypothetical protein
LTLETERLQERLHVFNLLCGIDDHQVDYALATAALYGGAADMLHRDIKQLRSDEKLDAAARGSCRHIAGNCQYVRSPGG